MHEAIVEPIRESTPPGRRHYQLWFPPLKQWQLYVLLVATCNLYAFFWIYCIARDIRDHGDPRVKPLGYSIALLIGIVAIFAAARLTWRVLALRGGERRRYQNLPPLVGLLLFVAYCLAIIAELGEVPLLYVCSVLLFPVPWLLVQARMNDVTSTIPARDFRAAAYRFSWRQMAAMGFGLVLWVGLLFAWHTDAGYRDGQALAADQALQGGDARYAITVPSADWVRIEPSALGDGGGDLALLGPRDSWAIVYVHDGMQMEDVIRFRAASIRHRRDVNFSETRTIAGADQQPFSYVSYETQDPFGKRWNRVTTAQAGDSVVELVVSSRTPGDDGARSLADSLTPLGRR